MKAKIKKALINIPDEIEYFFRRIYGKPSPLKQFIIILVLGGTLSIMHIYSLAGSVYNIGKRDARREYMMETEHIKPLELQQANDSINLLKQQMYE